MASHHLARLAEQSLDRTGDYRSLNFDDVWLSSAELHARARRLARGLVELGVEPGDRIGGYKYPREVHVVGAIPLTPIGKVDRKALRARLLDRVEA